MRLLIVTQVVDKNHPVLGFFHRWVEEFSKHYEEVHVLCLQKGDFDLPANVYVHSLGKDEKPVSAVVYTWRFMRCVWQLRNHYDKVFVHMNPEYVLAGTPVWLWLRKPIYLWYTHGSVSLSLKTAAHLVTNIFTAAQEGMNLSSKKVVVTGHGIDVQSVSQSNHERDLDLITVGRISRIKNLEGVIGVLEVVRRKLPSATLTILGSAVDEDGRSYETQLKQLVKEKELDGAVDWVGGVPHNEVTNWLTRAKVFVHTAKNGSLDKVLLEALVAGTPIVTTSVGARSLPLGPWLVNSPDELSGQVLSVLEVYPTVEMEKLKTHVSSRHGLPALIESLVLKM